MSGTSTDHPTEALRRLAEGETDEHEAAEHVAEGCAPCTTELTRRLGQEEPRLKSLMRRLFFSEEEPSAEDLAEARARTRAWHAVGRSESRTAPELVESLLALPPAERRQAIRRSRRFARYRLALDLVDRARAEGFRDPGQALELARLAIEVAETLERAGFPRRMALDAQALAWAGLSNAHRIQAELIEAERAMTRAKHLLARGTGHLDTRAELLSLEGSLRTDQSRFADAMVVLQEAAEIYHEYGEAEREGKVLVKLGNAAGYGGDPERAVRFLADARELLEPEGRTELWWLACLSHAGWLEQSGRTPEARQALEELKDETLGRHAGFFLQQRIDWIGARIAWSEGARDEAEAELLGLRSRYEERDEVYDACLVTLDLAILYLEDGRTADVRDLAHQLVPVFASRGIHHEALAALALFQEAAQAERATVAFVRDLELYLERARNNPFLRYRNFS